MTEKTTQRRQLASHLCTEKTFTMIPQMFMLSMLLCSAFAELDCDAAKCPSIPKHYEEMGCEAITDEDGCCVTSFECPELKSEDTTKCFYRDEVLNQGERTNSTPSCSAKCICKRGKIQCAHIDCPSAFASYHKKNQNCVKQYDTNQCCATKTVCGDEVDKLETCTFEGETYREGQQMYPSNDCYKCVCTKNFDNATKFDENENCKKIDCGISLRNIQRIRDGCIPVYYQKDNCCPIGWRCPGDKHLIEADSPRLKDDGLKCKFGNWELNIGQSLEGEEECQKCTCTVPPMVHCISTC